MNDQNYAMISSVFDNDFGFSDNDTKTDYFLSTSPINTFDGTSDFLNYQDPLKHAYKHQFCPLAFDISNAHFVNPHYVDGYFRADGTYVKGFYRDGDGNPAINRTAEMGGGYIRSNPDGNPFNNLESI